MAERSNSSQSVSSTTTGIKCGRKLKARKIDNNVRNDSGSKAIGLSALIVEADEQTNNVVQTSGVPTLNQTDSGRTQGLESSQPIVKGGGPVDNADFWGDVAKLGPGAYGSVSQTSDIKEDLTSNVTVYGKGTAHGHLSKHKKVGGKETVNAIHYGTNSRSEEGYVNDDSIFKKFFPAKSGSYNLQKPSRALIINNKFDNSPDPAYKAKFREGAEADTTKMKNLFEKTLKFDFARKEENVSSKRLKAILGEFRADVKDNDCSSCFIIIMSHGGKAVNSVLMDDMKDADLYDDIVYEFSNHDDLRAIPKVFLVQACRDSKGPPLPIDRKIPPGIQDLLIGHSTSPHFPAWRHNVTGSVYFTVINEVFEKDAGSSTLRSMLRKVYNDERLKKLGQNSPVEDYGFGEYRFKL